MQLLCRNYCGSSGVWVSAEGSRKSLEAIISDSNVVLRYQRGFIHRRRFIEKELRLLGQEAELLPPIEAAAARCWLVSILNSTPDRSLLSSGCRLLCWHPVCTSNSARFRAHTRPINFSWVPRVALGRRPRGPGIHVMALIRTASQEPAKGCTGHSRRNGGNCSAQRHKDKRRTRRRAGTLYITLTWKTAGSLLSCHFNPVSATITDL